jgi:4,5-DOPA dioxygenase extradiol
VAFARWIEQAVLAQDDAALFDYRIQAPHAVRAHPTDEHLKPLFFALGVANGDKPYYLSREVMYGILAMDAVAFG